jgi:hypothetical protein
MTRAFVNALRGEHLLASILLLVALLGICGIPLVEASGRDLLNVGHQPHYSSHDHERLRQRSVSNGSSAPAATPTNTQSLDDAKDTINRALKALAVANKLRLDNPQFNRYEFRNATAIAQSYKPAPPLNYGQDGNSSNAGPQSKRYAYRRTTANSSTESAPNGTYSYSIPDELAEAARIVAEAQPIITSGQNLVVTSPPLPGTNDTNVMGQAILQPDGLHGWIPDVTVSTILPQNKSGATIAKRATSTFWMENMQQNGVSPFAPSGYKVWRNVMDYGAKGSANNLLYFELQNHLISHLGDGVTDDTAAINLAISDGGRCGVSCGSSTIYPAFVYFPTGTYLVSSPIIQYYNTQIFGNVSFSSLGMIQLR